MTDQPEDDSQATLGDVFDAVIGSMTTEQFEQLAERTGHRQVPPKQKAAETLSQYMQADNMAAEGRSVADVARELKRHGLRSR